MVVKQSPADSPAPKKPADHKEKSTKKSSTKTKSSSTKVRDSQSAVAEQSQSESKKKVRRSEQKEKSVTKRSKAVSGEVIVESVPEQEQVDLDQATKKVTRPEDEVVTYTEFEFDLKEIPPEGDKILIGPSRLTRFEKARITGARALAVLIGRSKPNIGFTRHKRLHISRNCRDRIQGASNIHSSGPTKRVVSRYSDRLDEGLI